MTLLTMIEDFKPSGSCVIVGREMALVLAAGCYKPAVAKHIAGIANKVADSLSRKHDPSCRGTWKVPSFLEGATEVFPEERTRGWWRTLVPPNAGPPPAAHGTRRGRHRKRKDR